MGAQRTPKTMYVESVLHLPVEIVRLVDSCRSCSLFFLQIA